MGNSDARANLLDLANERGASLAGLSTLIGRNASYLQQYIRKGSPKKLEEQDRRTLAKFFGGRSSSGVKIRNTINDIIDALVRRVRVVAQRGAYPGDFVGCDGGADARATHHDPAICPTRLHVATDEPRYVRKIDRLCAVRSVVYDIVAQ